MQMRRPLTALFFPLAAAVLLTEGCGGKTGERSSSSAPLPVWEPDAKLLEQLGPVTAVEEYQVRPPKAYSLNPPVSNGSGGIKAFYWAGPLREDKTAPHFLIGLVSSPAGEGKDRTLEQYFDELLEGFKRRRANWTQTSPEHGEISGLRFVRAYWSGIDHEKHRKMHGFMYATKDGSTFIHISSQEVEPHQEQALKLAESAVLTFKKK